MGVPPSSGVELVVDVSLHSLSLRRRIFGWQGGSRGDGPHRVERMGPKKRSWGPKGSHAASRTCGMWERRRWPQKEAGQEVSLPPTRAIPTCNQSIGGRPPP